MVRRINDGSVVPLLIVEKRLLSCASPQSPPISSFVGGRIAVCLITASCVFVAETAWRTAVIGSNWKFQTYHRKRRSRFVQRDRDVDGLGLGEKGASAGRQRIAVA